MVSQSLYKEQSGKHAMTLNLIHALSRETSTLGKRRYLAGKFLAWCGLVGVACGGDTMTMVKQQADRRA